MLANCRGNPAIVKAFRRIGLSDQAGTGIRAIFRNWHELGRTPPQLTNDKARKQFELVLINKPLVTDAMQRFRQTVGANLSSEQADVLALALEKSRISLTDIRGLGIGTTQQANTIADHLIGQQLLERLSDTQFQVPERLQQRFEKVAEQVAGEVTGEVTGEVLRLLAVMAGEMKRAEIQQVLGLKHEEHFRDAYLLPALNMQVIEMTQPDKPRSSKQRYRLTERGLTLLANKNNEEPKP